MPLTSSDLKANTALLGEVFTEAIQLQMKDFNAEKTLDMLTQKFSQEKLQPLLSHEFSIPDAVNQYLKGNGLQDIMQDKTGVNIHREWRGVSDTLYDYVKWLELWGILGKWFARHPKLNLTAILRYRWMMTYLTTPYFFDHCVPGQRGTMLRASRMNLNTVAKILTASLEQIFTADENLSPGNEKSKKIIYMDAYMPKLITAGFSEHKTILSHLIPHYIPSIMNQHYAEHYIDVTESYGVTPDVCGLPSLESGVAIDDDFPKIGCCYISTNMPCDGSIMSSTILDRRFQLPTFVLNTPMRHTRDDVQEYAVEEMKACIEFLEEQTGETYNYDLLREACIRWNQQNELRLEKWDMNMSDNPPHYGAASWAYRILTYQDACGSPLAIKNDLKVNKLLRESMDKPRKYPTAPRHRAVVWNTVANMYGALDEWMLNCWGIECVAEFIEFQGHQPIDVSTDETMLAGVAHVIQQATMRAHSKGGYNVILDDLWVKVEQYHADLVIMQDQISCKGPGAISGLFEEEARKRGVRMIWLKQDLVDCRTISRRDMRDQISKYMDAVLNETPIDSTLLDFDDSESW